jgi:pimeloyl-ACP methyl ester carboxylesterase
MPESFSNNLQTARNLRNLYFARTAVQLIWAGTVLVTAANKPGIAAILLILYPLWDVACTLYELRSGSNSGTTPYLNAALGTITAIAIGITVFSHPMYAVAAFGAWALAAGLLQLAAGVSRRKKFSGQWAMILSGAQSTAAGVAFVAGGLSGKVHIADLGGYAIFGGIYFLIGGILLSRKLASVQAAVVLTLGLLLVCGIPSAHAQVSEVRNVVLVHGAFGNAASWNKVIPILRAKGLHVTAVALPLTSLADDVATLQRALALEDGPVILVAHSYGGEVITEAGIDPKVSGLVYVAALAPDSGQSGQDLEAQFPATPVNSELRPDANGFVKLTAKGVAEDFAQDLSPGEKALIDATQSPTFGAVFDMPITDAAWHQKPSWFIIAADDRVISPDLERATAERLQATTLELPSSHVVMLSKPLRVATFIEEAVRQLNPAQPSISGR